MGEFFAEYVLAGKIDYKRAVYTFYYKFPEHADDYLYALDTILMVENRQDLVLSNEKVEQIKELAKTNRNKLISSLAASVRDAK